MTNLLGHARNLLTAIARPIKEAADARADYVKAIADLRDAVIAHAAREGVTVEATWRGDMEVLRLGGVEVALASIAGIAPPPPIAVQVSLADGPKANWNLYPPAADDLLPVVAYLRSAAERRRG
ncbi:hypothetical protein AB0F17_62405 [Nonomuraea sp. NPDC026600]|uniref:hypothetical protein n=1 Tax=Nonomuraea sp. NPDC026600 TaxID=3155363 RepID=UPI0033FBBCAA